MGFVEQMKWWHWVLISLALGALLAYVNSGGADTSVNHESDSTVTFETGLLLRPWVDPNNSNHREGWFRDLVIHPVEDVPVGSRIVKMQLVSFTRLMPPDKDHPSGSTQTQYVWAPYPYEPTPRGSARANSPGYPGASIYLGKKGDTLESLTARFYHKSTPLGIHAIIYANSSLREAHGPADIKITAGRAYWIPWDPAEGHTVSDFIVAVNQFLQKTQGANAIPISFHYRWWENSRYTYEAWMIGTFLIVGVIWPTLLGVMLRGGFGRLTPQEYDLSRFKGAPEPEMSAKPATPVVTKSDMEKLRELEKNMEETLKAGALAAPAAAAAAPAAQSVVKKLAGGPAEAAPAIPAAQEGPKEYTGEFYPVVKPIEKKKDKP
jgi:hypothetical protein